MLRSVSKHLPFMLAMFTMASIGSSLGQLIDQLNRLASLNSIQPCDEEWTLLTIDQMTSVQVNFFCRTMHVFVFLFGSTILLFGLFTMGSIGKRSYSPILSLSTYIASLILLLLLYHAGFTCKSRFDLFLLYGILIITLIIARNIIAHKQPINKNLTV
ncbi:hypothetical protein BLOT_004559 [Blomia tropicalis]|nr:hypothetical protein BLOT_004559 [Blomia tropicalis]